MLFSQVKDEEEEGEAAQVWTETRTAFTHFSLSVTCLDGIIIIHPDLIIDFGR